MSQNLQSLINKIFTFKIHKFVKLQSNLCQLYIFIIQFFVNPICLSKYRFDLSSKKTGVDFTTLKSLSTIKESTTTNERAIEATGKRHHIFSISNLSMYNFTFSISPFESQRKPRRETKNFENLHLNPPPLTLLNYIIPEEERQRHKEI